MLFGILADAVEDNANLGAQAIDIAHRTHNGVLNARAKAGPHAVEMNVESNLRDAIRSLGFKAHGVCSEHDWSYEAGEYDKKTNRFRAGAKAAKKPPVLAQNHAHHHTAAKYFSIQGQGNELKQKLMKCLNEGHSFVFGMKTYKLLGNVQDDGHGLRTSNCGGCLLISSQTRQRPRT